MMSSVMIVCEGEMVQVGNGLGDRQSQSGRFFLSAMPLVEAFEHLSFVEGLVPVVDDFNPGGMDEYVHTSVFGAMYDGIYNEDGQ